MKGKAVIFDLDGVLVDTAAFHYRGWKRLADELGVPFDERANEKLRGVPRRESLLALLGRHPGEDKIKEYSDRKNGYYLELVGALKPGDVLPGVRPLLESLKKAGVKMALASSSKNARLVLKRVGIGGFFDAIVDGNQIERGKPDPELFLKAAARLGVSPRDCLVVEDAESGIEAAISAGMHTLGVGPAESLGRAERVDRDLSAMDVASIETLLDGDPAPSFRAEHNAGAGAGDEAWDLHETGFTREKQAFYESLFALGNGTMGVRGSVEEHDLPYPDSRPGTFVAGVFDRYESWYQAIVNLPFPFATRFTLAGERVSAASGRMKKYRRTLDMRRGLLTRSFVWADSGGRETSFRFERLVSMAEPHLAALRVTFRPLNWSGRAAVENLLDAGVDNIDFHKGGYQLRCERYHFVELETDGDFGSNSVFQIVKTRRNSHRVAEAVRFRLLEAGRPLSPRGSLNRHGRIVSRKSSFTARRGSEYRVEKMIGVHSSRDGFPSGSLAKAADRVAASALERGFDRVAEDHCAVWRRRWRAGDVAIEGHAGDQQAMRFSIFHLTQFANPRDPKVNIGSRGLTAEMHYGNCFWDTELFIMPFYIHTWPESARALLEYRYHTLPEARNKARRMFFRGAMFPWMSSYPGKEQADYWEYANIAVHIIGDINYAMAHYLKATGDEPFVDRCGAEVILETARFWNSRAFYNPRRKCYVINTVKGPNEYDGVVNNNTYTNWMARFNLRCGLELAGRLKRQKPRLWASLSRRLKLGAPELREWKKTADGLFINYDAARRLHIEDDTFLDREPFEMKQLKPGKKIITELGVSWDTLLRLQIVKQADILLLMQLFPDRFTREQKLAAWKFYEPRTCHDSSLSYCTHAIMASELGLNGEAIDYWDRTARLDLDDLMENSCLGVHSACVGGTWQIAVFGFAGMRLEEDGIGFTPRLPARWKKLEFSVINRGRRLRVSFGRNSGRIVLDPSAPAALKVRVAGRSRTLQPGESAGVRW